MLKLFSNTDEHSWLWSLLRKVDGAMGSRFFSDLDVEPPPSLESADAAIGKKGHKSIVKVEPAPEPSEINWANLELDTSYEYRAQALTYTLTVVFVLGVMFLSTWIKSEQIGLLTLFGYQVPLEAGVAPTATLTVTLCRSHLSPT